MVLCAAFNCHVRSGHKIALYEFPSDPDICKRWVMNIKRAGYKPNENSRLCKNHFEKDQFTMDLDIAKSVGYKIVPLKTDAIPTIFDFSVKPEVTINKRKTQPSGEAVGLPKKKRQSKAVVKRRALATLQSLTSPEFISTATDVEEIENEPPVPNIPIIQTNIFSASIQDDETATLFHAFTQTPKNLTPRRTVGIQTDMLEKSQPKPTTREIETQTDLVLCDLEEDDLNCSFISNSSDPDWFPLEEKKDTIEQTQQPAKERKFIVFESCIDSLFQHCNFCASPNTVNKITRGSMLVVNIDCATCGYSHSWESQPQQNNMPLGNLLIAGAIMFSGSSPVQALSMFNHSGIEMFSIRTYNNIQSLYLVPAINSVWHSEQLILFNQLKESNQPLILGGDARCCSPGHTAKYGSYSLMDLRNSKVLDMQLVQSNEVKNSYAMELEGLIRCVNCLMENGLRISTLVTDRHSQVKAYMKNQRPEIEHHFDCWHVAKGIYKKLEKAGKAKACKVLLNWARSISNHLYWCAASSNGDGEMVLQKWQSILNHVTDKHDGHGDKFPECQHEPLEERAWIKNGSAAYVKLEQIVNGRLLVKDVKKLSPGEQTSDLESYHSVVCHFAPKLVHFFHSQMEARILLAVLHFNENSARPQALTKDGNPMYTISYPKSRKGEGIAKEVKIEQTFRYIEKLMDEILLCRKANSTYEQARKVKLIDKIRPGPICQSTPNRKDKQSIVDQHVSRFNKLN